MRHSNSPNPMVNELHISILIFESNQHPTHSPITTPLFENHNTNTKGIWLDILANTLGAAWDINISPHEQRDDTFTHPQSSPAILNKINSHNALRAVSHGYSLTRQYIRAHSSICIHHTPDGLELIVLV